MSIDQPGIVVKGILKSKDKKSTLDRNARWDEGNLVETSIGRGTRQKIDQPDTPYAYPGDYSSYSDDSHSESNEHEKLSKVNCKKNVESTKPGVNPEELFRKLEQHQEAELKQISFKDKRKLHYQEGKMWKESKSKGTLEDL